MVAACIALFVTFFVQKLLQGNVDILGIVITGPVRGEGGDPVALNKQVGTAEHGYPCSVLFHDLLFQRSLNYFNTDVMSRVAAARGIVDDTERLTEYAALEKQIVEEDAAWVPKNV